MMYPEQMGQSYNGPSPQANTPPSQYYPSNAQETQMQSNQMYPSNSSMQQMTNSMNQMNLSNQPGGPIQNPPQYMGMTPGMNPMMPPGQPGMNPMMAPGQPGMHPMQATPPTARSRIDPNQIPSPVAVQEADQATYLSEPYRTCSKQIPPLASTNYRVIDEGICSPRFLRMTSYNVPCTEELLIQSMMPFGALVQPLAELEVGEAPIEVITPSASGPMRCRRCRAYVNAFMPFIDGGRKFTCNFCTLQNEGKYI
jgi:protein transport protein SEC24